MNTDSMNEGCSGFLVRVRAICVLVAKSGKS